MPFTTLTAWLMLMFPLVYSPGPANTLFASNGAQFGFRKSLLFMAGIDVSFVLQSLLAGFGLSALLVRFPLLFDGFRYVGILYILYLGVMFLRSAALDIQEQPRCLSFKDGFILTLVNPKAWVMQMMMFTEFLEKGDAYVASVFKLTAWLAVLNISGHVAWVLLGSVVISRATTVFTARMQNVLFAAMLLGSVFFLL